MMGLLTLVRHGQASFGTDDYDRLSGLGHEQAAALGAHLGSAGRDPDLLIVGGMRRQRETCASMARAAGWDAVPLRPDPAWDEYDHEAIVAGVPGANTEDTRDSRSFQHRLEEGLALWARETGEGGRFGPETWTQFRVRARAGLTRAVAEAGPGRWVVVVSSAGPISLTCARLALPAATGAAGGAVEEAAMQLWPALNRVLVNSAQSRVVVGRSGVTLLSFNEHQHLAAGQVSSR